MIRLIACLTMILSIACSQETMQYDKSKKYYLSSKEKKAETYLKDQAHKVVKKNLKSDHNKETAKRNKKLKPALENANKTRDKRTHEVNTGEFDLY